jgi:DNA-binding transcriptional LysR family regulator
LERLA